MSDLTDLTAELATTKTGMYNRLVAQGDTTIQAGDSMATYLSHYASLVKKAQTTITITENGTYTPSTSNVSGYGTITVNVSSGGSAIHKPYSLLDRVYDDSNAEIGTVSGFFIDGNGVEYAVVCLDATYRNSSASWASATGAVTNMPLYDDWTVWEAPETATTNCDLILAYRTSSAVSHCRQYSFTIDGTIYYGQLPNIIELVDIAKNRTAINTADTSGGSLTIGTNKYTWSSTQNNAYDGWIIDGSGSVNYVSKSRTYFVCPVLEIPNTV